MSLDLRGFQIYKGEKREKVQEMKYTEPREWDTTPQMANFQKAMRSRNYKDLLGDIEDGHLSAALCHLANTSYRVGRKLHFDPAAEVYGGDPVANQYLTRDYRRPYVVPEKV
jgi:hypothetical protein